MDLLSNQHHVFLQREPLPSPCSTCLHTVVTPWRRQGATCRWWCHMMPVTSHRRYEQQPYCVSTSSYFCVLCSSASSLSLCQNGSYVLPMLWWGSPLKLACPVKMATPAPSYSPSVFCSTMGMVVQIKGQEQDIAMLGVIGIILFFWILIFDYNKLNGGCFFVFLPVSVNCTVGST